MSETTLAILASGEGTTAESLIQASQDGRLLAHIGLVITNNPGAGVLGKVEKLNADLGLSIETAIINSTLYPDPGPGKPPRGHLTDTEADKLAEVCKPFDRVLLSGYLKKVRGGLLEKPVLNGHRGPLPETAGFHSEGIEEEVIKQGLSYSAITLHEVIEEYDKGRILCEQRVLVRLGETPYDLSVRMKRIEKHVLPHMLNSVFYGTEFHALSDDVLKTF